MSRKLIKFKDASAPHIVISFSDDKKFFPTIKGDDGCIGILRLEIFDADDAILAEWSLVPEKKIFNENHAKQILSFIDKNIKEIELIICQCDGGISRSSGCAAALSKILNGVDDQFFKPPYCPNRLIYRTVLNEFINNDYLYEFIKKKFDKIKHLL